MRKNLLPLLLSLVAAPAALAQSALLVRDGQLGAVPVPGGSLPAVLAKVVAGPDASERSSGWSTAIPAGTELLGVRIAGRRAIVTLGARFLDVVARDAVLELAIHQLVKTALGMDPRLEAVDLLVVGPEGTVQPLHEILDARAALVASPTASAAPPADPDTAQALTGALSGRRIALSPAHGYYWHSTLGWTTQRPNIGGLTEDIHCNEIVLRHLIPYLENLGATVISCRELGEILTDRVADNDAGAPGYVETGGWTTSASSGWNGGSYRYATTRTSADASAAWTIAIPVDGQHPVYAWYRSGTNRATDARYDVHHSGGVETVVVDQTRDGSTWRYLGVFHFTARSGARVVLTNESALAGRVVIADAIRVGAGPGSIARGAGISGRPRWQEASRYWAQFAGAPASVWDSVSGGEDNDDDVTCRPRFAEWRGADAYVSLHTNAGGGLGTSSYIYDGGATAGSSTLQARIHDQIIADLRASYDPTWRDRGKLQANFGEVRVLSSMPGVLLELAFHDVDGSIDHRALHDPVFRRLSARAIARGVLRYFSASAPFPPEPPQAPRVTQDGARGLRVAWEATGSATEYSVEQSPDGKGFVEVARVAAPATSWSTGPLAPSASLSFRVRAHNATGRSLPTEVLSAGTSHTGRADLLLVQAFDRLERSVKLPENTSDYLRHHARAIRDADAFSLGFDATSNEALQLGRVSLPGYRAVDWACGEESTAHETFSDLEQTLVRAYLAGGGRLLVSGSEIGWDLDARGSASDRSFYRDVLGTEYVADDAGTYGFVAASGGLFQGLPPGTFDDGTQGTYDVDWPDVLRPSQPSGRLDLLYSNLTGAAVLHRDATAGSIVLNLGFPLETITSPTLRASIMARALRHLLAPRTLDTPALEVRIGTTAPLSIVAPASAGRPWVLAAALATSPPIVLPGGAILPLAADGVFGATLATDDAVFAGFRGVLDASGAGAARIHVPNLALLRGLSLYVSGLTIASGNVGEVLEWQRVLLQ